MAAKQAALQLLVADTLAHFPASPDATTQARYEANTAPIIAAKREAAAELVETFLSEPIQGGAPECHAALEAVRADVEALR